MPAVDSSKAFGNSISHEYNKTTTTAMTTTSGGAASLGNNGGNAAQKRSSTSDTSGLPDAVSHFYYKHGLFLSSYPTCATSIAIMAILLSCYPLINIPLPGTIPTKIMLPFDGRYSLFAEQPQQNVSLVRNFFSPPTSSNFSYDPPFPWAKSSPVFYVQQIMLRTSVLPWTEDMQLMDAYRAPLYEVFKLLEIVRNHESADNKRTLDQSCWHVDNVKRTRDEKVLFPEYNCLLLSPANLWYQDVQNFTNDSNLLNTIFQYHNLQKTKVSIAEMLFGVPMQDSGFKRYPLRSRSRIIQYAITLILKQNDLEYLSTLKHKLFQYYPPLQLNPTTTGYQPTTKAGDEKSAITYIFYPDEFKLWEFMPLAIAFVLLFIYMYFSVRKIEIIRSRLLLAVCAVITVLGSLTMSLGVCSFFGLTISLQSKDVFPYLVILVGLENCLVITKSVVYTQETFDVKIRVAKALSKEGWHISKTLLTEITILTIGCITMVPVIQKFSIFAIIGLLSDFMLQMLLFPTILAMNIKLPEYTTEAKHLPKMMLRCTMTNNTATPPPGGFGMLPNGRNDYRFYDKSQSYMSLAGDVSTTPHHPMNNGGFGMFHRSQSHPKLTFADLNTHPADLTAKTGIQPNKDGRIPKRLRIVNFWARTRFFQRAFMIWMSVWICTIVYNSGCLENLFAMDGNRTSYGKDEAQQYVKTHEQSAVSSFFTNMQHVINGATTAGQDSDGDGGGVKGQRDGRIQKGKKSLHGRQKGSAGDGSVNDTDAELRRLLYPDYEMNYFLSNFHWCAIMKQYNISLSGRYVTLLPTIKLSHPISAEAAVLIRNPKEKIAQNFQWKALAAALDPIDFNDDERRESPMVFPGGTPLYPKSPMEFFFVISMCLISIFVLSYTMVVFYRCICTRNYAEWRSSWYESSEIQQKTEHILEGVPTKIVGHKHTIECLITDGSHIISCCLRGQIKVWDSRSGENLTTIHREYMQIATKREDEQVALERLPYSPIWCMNAFDNLVAVGCANGRIELWEMPDGVLKCISPGEVKSNQGITHIYINGDRVIVARLCGRLEFFRLETYCKGQQIDWNFTSAYRRTHTRTSSAGSIGLMHHMQQQRGYFAGQSPPPSNKEEMKITLEAVRFAHQQPITCMEVSNGMVFTGSQDHTLKVYSLTNANIEYTLHGHCGPITCLFVDHWQPGTGGSGSQDGMLCVWDLFTGACMYNIQAHDGAVTALVCAPTYVISLGVDERICVWERFQGNLLTTINILNAYSRLLMLTPSLLVTCKMGSLIVWDVRTGEPAREVKLDRANSLLCPKTLMLTGDAVVCDYGNELRVVRFPIVSDKYS
ncbi:sterol regulatory element-binding protein cleavage-activating protein isoform X1 [Bactrocera dorsalis]|uniref:Sterol regulatory element-binding protein cleavage-activating protein n=1 Tax=Bactrocera dorsalis TaxID=27457 RepID=A0A6I9ULH5_BACDO|nr:sterol regulatory element-binding protein cleavage-activating protein isoform X1 [Bactrocera dorsalis]XP_011197875.2 sterol regulatory element-binding protein cleavage-activating protein isoform X1 [Bactrocera dorsalis]XP_019844568.2 sterol regulatory element-binding protein cleavage-activating protein isoform X1 [Bactrocera dorsalis]XP_019844570.2 sterol regulatory element-binding protein cleavage-activating protein isoform X1 [Bactrocera dorsalis]